MKKKIGDLTLRELLKIKANCKPSSDCSKCPLGNIEQCWIVTKLQPEPPAYEGMIFNQEIEVEE